MNDCEQGRKHYGAGGSCPPPPSFCQIIKGYLIKVIYTKYSKHSNEANTFMGLGRAGRFGQS